MKGLENKRQRRGQCLPLEQRIRLHDKVLHLREQGLSYGHIIETINRYYGVRLYSSRVEYWVLGLQTPLGRVNKFDERPSPELAGVIGAMLSDANRSLYGDHQYAISLKVKDRDYAEAFGHDLAKVLGKKKPYRPRWSRSQRCLIAKGSSILLFKYLDRPWQKQKPYIEANRTCLARFLRRFFDGEGSINGRTLAVYNTNKELLFYIQRLLRRYFDIETTGPYRKVKKGQRFRGVNGKIYRINKTCYYVRVRASGLPMFQRYIGFTIERKQRRLTEAVR